jgi:WD40 repeat protein
MVVAPGKDPAPLVATSEDHSSPVTSAGPNEIAFLIGPEPRRNIAMAALSNGRITRRIPFDKGTINSLASSPDGKVLYCAAGGSVWSIPVAGGEPRKIRAGDFAAVDPSGENLLVEVVENPLIRLIQVPLGGGAEREIPIPQTGSLRPASMISPNAIDKGGRILTALGASSGFWRPGLADLRTGAITPIPVAYITDYQVLGWMPDGKVMALGMDVRSKCWKFQTEVR